MAYVFWSLVLLWFIGMCFLYLTYKKELSSTKERLNKLEEKT